MRNKYAANHVLLRDGVFYYVRRVPIDLAEYYGVKRLCFSLRTKSYKSAIQASSLYRKDLRTLAWVKTAEDRDSRFTVSEVR